MTEIQDLSIEEIKISLQKYIMELDKIESQITSSMNLFKENFSLLKSKKSNEAVSLGLIYESNLREERQEIMKQYADSFQKINQIKKEMIKVNDLIFNSFLNQIDNLLNAINDDSSSIISTSDRSLSDDLNELYENNYVNNELVSQINDIKKPDGMPEPNLSSINNNSDGSNNNLMSGNIENNIINSNSIFKCSEHKDKNANYQCRRHCDNKFCMECFRRLGNTSEHGELMFIGEIVNTNSNGSPKAINFLEWIKQFFEITLKKCNILINMNKIPDLPPIDNVNFLEFNEQIVFLSNIFEEFAKIEVLNEEVRKPNEQLLKIIKKITLSQRVILQSATVNINIFSKLREIANFYLTVFPHKNLNITNKLKEGLSIILKNKFNTTDVIADDRAFIISNNYIDSKTYKNIYNIKQEEILNYLNILKIMSILKSNFLIKDCSISPNNLEVKLGVPFFTETGIQLIGGEKYFAPLGWFGLGIKNNIDTNWPIAYITFSHKCNNSKIKQLFNEIIEYKKMDNLVIKKKDESKYESDKRSWSKIGSGIHLFQKIQKAERYTGTFDINGKKYKILLMARVQQNKIKEPKNNKIDYWVVEKEFVKIFRILFKENIKVN